MDVATSNCRSISADMSQNYASERQPLIHNFSCPHLLWRISFFHKLKYDRHLYKNCWTTFKDADRLHKLHKKTLTHRTDSSHITNKRLLIPYLYANLLLKTLSSLTSNEEKTEILEGTNTSLQDIPNLVSTSWSSTHTRQWKRSHNCNCFSEHSLQAKILWNVNIELNFLAQHAAVIPVSHLQTKLCLLVSVSPLYIQIRWKNLQGTEPTLPSGILQKEKPRLFDVYCYFNWQLSNSCLIKNQVSGQNPVNISKVLNFNPQSWQFHKVESTTEAPLKLHWWKCVASILKLGSFQFSRVFMYVYEMRY